MPIDPATAYKLAQLLFAGISAAASAIKVWQETRNHRKAADAFDKTFSKERDSQHADAAANQLVTIIPGEVIQDLEGRADLCWTGYRTVLGGEYLPDEIDRATKAVKACVCRELRRVYELNGAIPDRWKGQWERYDCSVA